MEQDNLKKFRGEKRKEKYRYGRNKEEKPTNTLSNEVLRQKSIQNWRTMQSSRKD